MTDPVSLFILVTCYIEAEYLAPRNPDPCGMHWRHQASPLAFSNLDFPLSGILIFGFTLLLYTHFCKLPELHFEKKFRHPHVFRSSTAVGGMSTWRSGFS